MTTTALTKSEARQLALELMTKHGLTDWNFQFDNAKRRLGQCKYRTKTISLSQNYLPLRPKAETKNTILHEIAHALVGAGHGHDLTWKMKAREIGCDAERLYKGKARVKGKYELTCPNCGTVTYRHKKTHLRSACGLCCNKYNGGRFSSDYIFKWKTLY